MIFTTAVVLDLLIVAAVTADLGQHLSLQVYKSVFVLARRICLYRLIDAVASLGACEKTFPKIVIYLQSRTWLDRPRTDEPRSQHRGRKHAVALGFDRVTACSKFPFAVACENHSHASFSNLHLFKRESGISTCLNYVFCRHQKTGDAFFPFCVASHALLGTCGTVTERAGAHTD